MLMPRLQYHFNGYNPELSLALSMQQQHINQLLTTAATATGIVGDVDALLTPIHSNKQTPVRMETGRERNLWRTNEIMEVLKIMQQVNALDMLNQKAMKSDVVFRKVERLMFTRGFRKKSHIQISTKWKFLKSTYRTSRRNGIIPKMIPQPIYEELHKMLHNTTNNLSARSISDCGNSVTSLDGDNSNGAMENGISGGNESQLIISGVEGGYGSGNKTLLDECANGQDSEEENGLAHPIFGFRLGLVKQEPADTGYESGKAKQKDSTANIQFQTEIKQEVNEDSDSPMASNSATPQPQVEPQLEYQQPQQRQSAPEIMILSRRATRPSTSVATSTSNITATPNATSTPKIVPTVSQTRSGGASTASPTPLPPLRIAPFAKVPPSDMATPLSTANLPPPPPLAMNPTSSRAFRLSSAYSSSVYANGGRVNTAAAVAGTTNTGTNTAGAMSFQRKFTLNGPKGLTIAATSGRPAAVQPYVLHQEVVVPDLDIAAAPHEYRAQQPFYGFPDGPSTSQQAQQMESRKRRLKASLMMSTVMPSKRMACGPETLRNIAPRPAAMEFAADDGLNASSDEASNSAYQTASQQQQQQQPQQQEPPTLENVERENCYARVLQDVAVSLRQMQREVINEFFKRQMKLAREEHEFQMQQDAVLMQAFKEQAQHFQKMSKELMGSAVKLEKRKKRREKQQRKQLLNYGKLQTRQIQQNKCENAKVLHNGKSRATVTNNAVKDDEEPGDGDGDRDEDEEEDGVKLLMRNVHAQLELSDDEGGEDTQNQYEYEVNEYMQDNSNDLEQSSREAMSRQEGGEEEEEVEEQNDDMQQEDYASDPIQITGH